MPDPIERLSALFERFPGIGPRQASRFVQFVLRGSASSRRELIEAIEALGSGVRQCPDCQRFHAGSRPICSICASPTRDRRLLAIVANDTDLSALERSGTFNGLYFVIGGTISLASEKATNLRIPQLAESLTPRADQGLKEVILAFPANPEGDATATRLREDLELLCDMHEISMTNLGRGLSTGSELEYADAETIKTALESRK